MKCLVGLVLFLHWIQVQAIFEDQAGQNDWYQQHIGGVSFAEFAFRSRERVFLATEANVVSSLDLRDGSIAWRQVLVESDTVKALALLPKPPAVATLSASGPSEEYLRLWQAHDGGLLWERLVEGLHSEQTSATAAAAAAVTAKPALLVLPDVTGDGASELAVFAQRQLQVLSGSSGEVLWKTSALQHWPDVQLAHEGPSADGSHTLKAWALTNGGRSVLEATFAAKDGEPVQEVHETRLAAPRTNLRRLADGSLSQLSSEDVAPGAWAVSPTVQHEGKEILAYVAPSSTAAAHALVVADARSGAVVNRVDMDLPTSKDVSGNLIAASGIWMAVRVKGQATQYRILVALEDKRFILIEDGKIIWTRQESLATLTSSIFLELPAKRSLATSLAQSVPLTLRERLEAEFLGIKGQLGFATAAEKARLGSLKAIKSQRGRPDRDPTGFRKLMVAISEAGALHGIHTGDGRLLWTLPVALGQQALQPSVALLPWQSSHDPSRAPTVALLVAGRPSELGARLLIVNGHSGVIQDSLTLSVQPQQIVAIPGLVREGLGEQSLHLLVDGVGSTPRLHLLPDTPAARSHLARLTTDLHFWSLDPQTGALSGYAVDKKTLAALQIWSIQAAQAGQAALTVASQDPRDKIYSPVKVLGDKSLKVKYLNPNLLLVASGTPAGVSSDALGQEVQALHILLLDTVTGRPVFRQSHKGARGPVKAVLCENWAIYQYWSITNHRFEMAVVELYDQAHMGITIPDLLLHTSNATRSAFDPIAIEASRQSFYLPSALKAFAVTRSARGATAKFLLFGTTSDQVYMMDKRQADPRRPMGKPTAQDMEERLAPYQELLPLIPQAAITMDKQVARLS
ncbi:hypothetical protein WJX74_010737, partial [Apatococcus lobatus]